MSGTKLGVYKLSDASFMLAGELKLAGGVFGSMSSQAVSGDKLQYGSWVEAASSMTEQVGDAYVKIRLWIQLEIRFEIRFGRASRVT
ncbi:hypothetical protein CEP53_012575 [Fusarium sp. AF-6]|nr:hypothetical protein CEP53_012575 [Fusarium sp. AF-6]